MDPKAEGGRPEKEVLGELAAALDRRRGDIEHHWLSRVMADVAKSGVSPTELRDAMPDYLVKLASSLRRESSTIEARGATAWRDTVREHALTRVRQGFDVSQLVHEFIILRQVIFEILREENLLADSHQAGRVADLVESAIAEAVKVYVESRDYAARRTEAEHVGFITHELRTPLTTVQLLAQRIRRRLRLSSELERSFDVLQRNLLRLEHLIGEILTVERLEAGEMTPHLTAVPLGEVLDIPLHAARLAAEGKGVQLDARFEPETRVLVDPQLTQSVVQNLLDNAIKFTDEGHIELSAEESPEEVVVHVRDNCDGISERDLATVFEPFRRGPSRKPGTGLGLAIARRAVEAQGGTIDAESPGPRGCHFSFSLRKAS